MKLKASNPAEQRLLDVFNEQASESLKERVAAGKKTVMGALSYLTDYARKKYAKSGPCAVMDSDEIICQFFHYLEEDSLDFECKAPSAKVVTSPDIPNPALKHAPTQKHKGPEQLDLFDSLLNMPGKAWSWDATPIPTPEPSKATEGALKASNEPAPDNPGEPDAEGTVESDEPDGPDEDAVETTEAFWDCECETDYIHKASESCCPICGAVREDQPDSRVSEVESFWKVV